MPLKVLTVDDSKTIRMIVKKAFRPFDCELCEAENGVEGLAAASREKPDLIILDITMPIMNGIEMLEKLKGEASLKDIPVIMLTAESGQDNVMRIVKMGVRDYMVKPFKGEQLIERVKGIAELQAKKADTSAEDVSRKYCRLDGDVCILTLPHKLNRMVLGEVEGALKTQLAVMKQSGNRKFILDLSQAVEISMSLIKLIILVQQQCQAVGIDVRIVGSAGLSAELHGFQETSSIQVDADVEAAKAAF
jgi:DNA-binding response OmpR family regulator